MISCLPMLIINADDLGGCAGTTDRILACYRQGLITSASAMVFMADSARAAKEALEAGLDTGFHLNLDRPLTSGSIPRRLREHQETVVHYLNSGTWAHVVYNPFLKRPLSEVYHYQLEEYRALYGKDPSHINGHHHRHLCMNMLAGRVIPPGTYVRRNFALERGYPCSFADWYRLLVDLYLARRFRCPDKLYSLEPIQDLPRLERIIRMASSLHVELMVHPARDGQFAFLMSAYFQSRTSAARRGTFRDL
jgi:predicted glycoside hydrolase/deacetylase ChbG (UPF0249 family)